MLSVGGSRGGDALTFDPSQSSLVPEFLFIQRLELAGFADYHIRALDLLRLIQDGAEKWLGWAEWVE